MDTRYMKLDVIKQGGFGNVYTGWDFKAEKRVAIKELRDRTIDGIVRLAREERILREHVNNPHIVQILEVKLAPRRPR